MYPPPGGRQRVRPMSSAAIVRREPDLEDLNREIADASPEDTVRWAAEAFDRGLVMSSSFGAESAVSLHLVTRIVPGIPVIVIDTGYLFPETYRYIEQLADVLALNLAIYQSPMSAARMEALYGRPWENGGSAIDEYNRMRKVEPMQRALRELGATAWIAGLRAEQTRFRSTLRPLEQQNEVYKIHPILRWTARDVQRYMIEHELPPHPLYELGYRSIGDTHSTRPTTADMNERDGRFDGVKQECGLHLPLTEEQNRSLGSSRL